MPRIITVEGAPRWTIDVVTLTGAAAGQPDRPDSFPSALNVEHMSEWKTCGRLTTLRELEMLRLMNDITDKDEWNVKVFKDEIVNKWNAEIEAAEFDVTENMWNWVIDELRYKAESFGKTGITTILHGHTVKSDCAIPSHVKENLKAAVSKLENVPREEKDYHPNTDNQVLDLVHPSLFPLIVGRSRIVKGGTLGVVDGINRTGEGDVLKERPDERGIYDTEFTARDIKETYSEKFQWLPCEVTIKLLAPENPDNSDIRCTIESYINNLHPDDHKGLYPVLEEIIARAIPLWNLTLSNVTDAFKNCHLRIDYDAHEYEYPDQRPTQRDDESEDGFCEREAEWEDENRITILPDADEFEAPGEPKVKIDLQKDYGRLQVIVKLANIELTPDKPEYGGGSWHVEGQMNEHICATALYYYDSENITESHLSFRQQCRFKGGEELIYDQHIHDFLPDVYGLQNGESIVQEIGSVLCREDRLLTFPNIVQHRVEPFSLEDRTKPGHRKIVALFLVDPNIRIISTANIPAQRQDWYDRLVPMQQILGPLPAELKNMVVDELKGFPISMAEAKELRLELMKERTAFSHNHDETFRQIHTFSLCEH
ncbi:hypothetical protein AJ80_01403 [Polytolypa hystricis UAMH7299]|uniref:Uncharacterized protein n=1 Tax=Polytolypa hystricis (strain UAMH7299) TaxID=1447883 RepID=A0A2B7YS18_POLH7|nr:hypothetical protein AJ80_01403 [Polytolypa hystricis UAMH7299]